MGDLCLQEVVHYRVVVTYAPLHDALEVAAGGERATGVAGRAQLDVSFPQDCGGFPFAVGGVLVLDRADYAVEVARQAEPPPLPLLPRLP